MVSKAVLGRTVTLKRSVFVTSRAVLRVKEQASPGEAIGVNVSFVPTRKRPEIEGRACTRLKSDEIAAPLICCLQ